MDVKYITVEFKKLSTIPIVDGQIIGLSDRDGAFYDMGGKRRSLSGQKVVPELPSDTAELNSDSLYIILEGDDQGIHVWTGAEFTKVAGINTDEKVKSEIKYVGKSYIVGSSNESDSIGTLTKHREVYIDQTTGKIHANGFQGTAEKALAAHEATKAGVASNDDKDQNIAKTYIKSVEPQGTDITVTYGDGTTKTFQTQDTNTHNVTNVVVAASPDSQENAVASNGHVHLNVSDDNQLRSSHNIKGQGSVEVTSDADGNISIKGTDTWRPNTLNQAGYVAPGQPDSVWGTDSDGNPGWVKPKSEYEHPNSGVTPGTYTKVTVNTQGHVTSGDSPNTLSGYGIIDGVPHKVLENEADLNTIWVSGIYSGTSGNTITNKPDNVDKFSLIVAANDDGSDGVQKMYSAGNQYSRQIESNVIGEWSLDVLTDTKYEHPTGPGFNHIPQGGQSGQVLVWSEDGTAVWGKPEEMVVNVMEGSTEDNEGKAGIVPIPPVGPAEAYLRNDGSWAVPPNTTYDEMIGATPDVDGESGLVPRPLKSDSLTFLGSDGQWHAIKIPENKSKWEEYIPQ